MSIAESGTAHTIDEAAFASGAENATMHSAVQNVVETIHGVDFFGIEGAWGDKRKTKGDIAGVLSPDERGITGREIVERQW